jgi:sodium transport system ATP-binding protein
MVRTHNIAKYFQDPKRGEIKAVDGINMEAVPGKIFGLLGSNGAGKTTLLRMLSTVIKPTGGTGEVAGFDIAKDPQKVRENIGFMSTSTALYGRSTGKEVIQYFAELYGLSGSKLRERVAYVIQQMEIEEFQNQLCDKLSTGQKQRVSIARTVVHDPPVLFFDEPTNGLDIVVSQTVLKFIEQSRDLGKTIVYCTHIMSEVERLCDHVVVLHDGVIQGEGTVDEVKAMAHQTSLEKAFLSLVGALDESPTHSQTLSGEAR